MAKVSPLSLLLPCIILLSSYMRQLHALEEEKYFGDTTILPEFTSLVGWIRSHDGGFVDHRLVVRGIPLQNNSTSYYYRGVFATKDIQQGDSLCYIPWSTILGPVRPHHDEFDAPLQDTVFHLAHEMKVGDESPYSPYLRILRSQQISVPSSWSLMGRHLFQLMLGDVLPPQHVERNVEWFIQTYGMHSHLLTAYFAVSTRAMQADIGTEWLLVPLVDQFNHHSDENRINTVRSASYGRGFEVRATQFIAAGSELFSRYWGDYTHYFLEEFGFVEDYPRRWKFDLRPFGGIELDVRLHHRKNTTKTNDTFDVEWFSDSPGEVSIDILEKELTRLLEFEKEHCQQSVSIPHTESDIIWEYHRALTTTVREVIIAATVKAQPEGCDNESEMIESCSSHA
jgi:hypothetical protein